MFTPINSHVLETKLNKDFVDVLNVKSKSRSKYKSGDSHMEYEWGISWYKLIEPYDMMAFLRTGVMPKQKPDEVFGFLACHPRAYNQTVWCSQKKFGPYPNINALLEDLDLVSSK